MTAQEVKDYLGFLASATAQPAAVFVSAELYDALSDVPLRMIVDPTFSGSEFDVINTAGALAYRLKGECHVD